MFESGVLEEAPLVPATGTASQAIGYREAAAHLRGELSFEDAVAAVAQATRRYAKRQLTWLRADARVHWVDVSGDDDERAPHRAHPSSIRRPVGPCTPSGRQIVPPMTPGVG